MRLALVARSVRHVVIAIGLAVAATLGSAHAVNAQQPAPTKQVPLRIADSSQVQVIRLRDGSSIVGRITEIGPDTVKFAAASGTLSIARADIVELRELFSNDEDHG